MGQTTVLSSSEKTEWSLGLAPSHARDLSHRAERFRELGRTVITATLEMASILVTTKDELPHGAFQSWCQEELGLSKQKVSNTLKAAETLSRLKDPEALEGCSLRTLAILSSASEGQLETALEIQEMVGKVTEQKARDLLREEGGQTDNEWGPEMAFEIYRESLGNLIAVEAYASDVNKRVAAVKEKLELDDVDPEVGEGVIAHYEELGRAADGLVESQKLVIETSKDAATQRIGLQDALEVIVLADAAYQGFKEISEEWWQFFRRTRGDE